VRGHLAANIDPLGLNNMKREDAKKMIIRSVTINDKVCRQSLFNLLIPFLSWSKLSGCGFKISRQMVGQFVCLLMYAE
jgi:hypothetical protein